MAINTRTGKETVTHYPHDALTGTTSTEIDLEGSTVVALRTPASLASTSITFLASDTSGGTFLPVIDINSNPIAVTVNTAANHSVLAPADFAGMRYIKLVYSTSETAKISTIVGRGLV